MLRYLQRRNPFLRRFRTWADVIVFMRSGTSKDPLKDEILRPIFQVHAADQDPLWRTILLVIFWPGLESLHWKKRFWDRDPDEFWQSISWVFLKVVCGIDVRKRPNNLVVKVFYGVIHELHEEYRRTWNRMEHEISIELEVLNAVAARPEDNPFAVFARREEQEIEMRRLRRHLEEGRISEADFLLIVGSRLYGKSIADYAREADLGYQAAKKRRQRAEMVIRRFEEEKV